MLKRFTRGLLKKEEDDVELYSNFFISLLRMKNFNEILYMPDAEDFLCKLNTDVRLKILYNISKAQYVKDPDLFKKINDEIWEFRTLYRKVHYRLLAFWDRKTDAVVVCSHAFVKKTQKTPMGEILKAQRLREEYFKENKL